MSLSRGLRVNIKAKSSLKQTLLLPDQELSKGISCDTSHRLPGSTDIFEEERDLYHPALLCPFASLEQPWKKRGVSRRFFCSQASCASQGGSVQNVSNLHFLLKLYFSLYLYARNIQQLELLVAAVCAAACAAVVFEHKHA